MKLGFNGGVIKPYWKTENGNMDRERGRSKRKEKSEQGPEKGWHDKAMLFEQYHWKKALEKNQPYKFKISIFLLEFLQTCPDIFCSSASLWLTHLVAEIHSLYAASSNLKIGGFETNASRIFFCSPFSVVRTKNCLLWGVSSHQASCSQVMSLAPQQAKASCVLPLS
ncbi:UNVERIFIED_CONTAM: hypothetical protein Scaly_1966000 [Sesamum calycinum]|uniref:Uncharacterized protein n=1 Tax=Sesamum calycinum TaxID=2727403 RepID=A0AAW2N1U5_9LAMI